MKMTFFLGLILSSLSLTSFGQSSNIKWGEKHKSSAKSLVKDINPISDDEAIVLRKALTGYGYVRRKSCILKNLQMDGKYEFGVSENRMTVYFRDIINMGDKNIQLIETNRSTLGMMSAVPDQDLLRTVTEVDFMVQALTDKGPKGTISSVYSSKFTGKGQTVFSDSYKVSENNKFVAFFRIIENSKTKKYTLLTTVVDSDAKIISQESADISVPSGDYTHKFYSISNSGELAVGFFQKEDKQGSIEIFYGKKAIKKAVIPIKGKIVYGFGGDFVNDELHLSGVYSDVVGKYGTIMFSFSTKEELNTEIQIEDLPDEVWTKDMDFGDKKGKKAIRVPHPRNFVFRKIIPTEDGGYLALLEQIGLTGTYANPGHIADNVIINVVDKMGKLQRTIVLTKRQIGYGTSDLISFVSNYSNGKLTLIFNDHLDNYDLSGKFLKVKSRDKAFFKKETLIVETVIDVNSGKMERVPLNFNGTRSELLLPGLAVKNPSGNSIILYKITDMKAGGGMFGLWKI